MVDPDNEGGAGAERHNEDPNLSFTVDVNSFPPQSHPIHFPPAPPEPVPFPPAPPEPAPFRPEPVRFSPAPHVQPASSIPPPSLPIPIHSRMPITTYSAWSTALFDCFDNPTNAVTTVCLPCMTFGQIAEILDDGHTSCVTGGVIYGVLMAVLLPCIYSYRYRTKLRARYNLPEAPAPDWLVHIVCECCAICQAYRELTHHGWDLHLGWQENVNRSQGVPLPMAAPYPHVMTHN